MNADLSITNSDLVSLNEACRLLPRRRAGKKPHIATLYRWATGGLRGIRLETVQVGATRCTSRAALDRFFEALSANHNPSPAPMTETPPLSDAAINRELDLEGL